MRYVSRSAASQSRRGKLVRSGTPGRKWTASCGAERIGAAGGDGGEAGSGGHARRRAAARDRVALGLELGVAIEHQAARQAELAGEGSRAGQAFVGGQPAGEDRGAQRALELRAEGLVERAVEAQQQLRAKPVHSIGVELDLIRGARDAYHRARRRMLMIEAASDRRRLCAAVGRRCRTGAWDGGRPMRAAGRGAGDEPRAATGTVAEAGVEVWDGRPPLAARRLVGAASAEVRP